MTELSNVPTTLAMQVAGVDRLKFNEAVSKDYYDAPEPASKGLPRLFAESDLIGLYILGEFLRFGIALPIAASRAEHIKYLVKQHPRAKRINWNWLAEGGDEITWNADNPKSGEALWTITFDLNLVRGILRHKLAQIVSREDS